MHYFVSFLLLFKVLALVGFTYFISSVSSHYVVVFTSFVFLFSIIPLAFLTFSLAQHIALSLFLYFIVFASKCCIIRLPHILVDYL